MIQHCSYKTARRLMEAGLFLSLSEMAYPVEPPQTGTLAPQLKPTDRCREWVSEMPQDRVAVPAPTLCELLQLVPVQLTCDLLGYWYMARYCDAVGKPRQAKHYIPVEAVGRLIIKLLEDRRVIIDPAEPHGPLIIYA